MNPQLNDENRSMWESNADCWNEKMGIDGNYFHNQLIAPKTTEFLNLKAGDELLDIGCGNGIFSRKMAKNGTKVCAFDFSEKNISHAKSYPSEKIEYHVLDATDKEAMLALGKNRFDAAVSNMVLMDIPEIEPMFSALQHILKPKSSFVFSLVHPCFNIGKHTLVTESGDRDGRAYSESFIKVDSYISPSYKMGEAILHQPVAQYYFHRPISAIFKVAFENGFILDGFEEPILENKQEAWYREIPLVMICRMRKST